MNVSLVMFKADGLRWDFAVEKPRIVIGRTSNCDLRIPLSSVSRQHCEIRVEGNEVKIRDLGSSNGTFHNHSRVLEATLKPGDEIVVGPVVFVIVIDGQPAAMAPRPSAIAPPRERPAQPAPEPKAAEPETIEAVEADDEDLSGIIEPDVHTPTVDLDDPIASLQALAEAESDDSGELPMLSEDDEDDAPGKK